MPLDSPLHARVRARLNDLDSQRLLRTMRPPSGIDLSSNDYLNLSAHPRVRAAFIAGIEREGCGSTGSRLLRGERQAFTDLEDRFARFKATERSLFFSSGFLANLAVLTGLAEKNDVIFSDERNHASLIDGARLAPARVVVCPHNDVEGLRCLMALTPCDGVRFVVIESLYSMDGDLARLREYATLCRANDAMLVVDEAHAVGIYGTTGSGLLEDAGVDANGCISINTAGKALGVSGAFVAGPSWAVEYLIQRARPFVFSTASPPAVAAALQASLDIVHDEPDRRHLLQSRAVRLRRNLRAIGVDAADDVSHIVPVIVGDNERALAIAEDIQADGFDVRAIRPPSVPAGTARLRLSVNAGLSEATLDRFVDVLSRALRRRTGQPCAVSS
jgi:8-amino-7-oxononanoate synthase